MYRPGSRRPREDRVSTKPIKVATFNRNFFRAAGGAESYSVSIVEGLADRVGEDGRHEFEMHVFAQSFKPNHPRVTYHKVPGPIRRRWVNQIWYSFYCWWHTRNGFDGTHSHENTWCGDVQTLHVRPVKYHLLEGLSGFRRFMRWVKIATSPRLLFYVWVEASRHRSKPRRVVVAVSESMREQTLRAFPACDPAMPIIPPGVNKPNLALSQSEARAMLSLPQECSIALFCGNDYARKGLRALLEALAITQTTKPLHLVVVGSEAQRKRFEEQARALGVDTRVHFRGQVADINVAYRSCDLVVHPTLEDTFAMIVLEALNYGLPVIVSSAQYCGISALLRDGKEALIIEDPHDAKGIAQKIEEILGSGSLREKLAQHGRAFAQDRQWSRSVDAYADIFKKLSGRKGAAPTCCGDTSSRIAR